jgi:tetratricopeptide (TPR) repeat protein
MTPEQLREVGLKCLDEEEWDRAFEVAGMLEELGDLSAFRIAALAHQGLDQPEAALKVLERGARKGATGWEHHHLLGCLYTELERYPEAEEAFTLALRDPKVQEIPVTLSQAGLARRSKRYEEAISLLDQIADPDWALHAATIKVGVLRAQEKYTEAISLGERALATTQLEPEAGHATLAAEVVYARGARGDPLQPVVTFALNALQRYDWNCPELLEALRQVEDRYSKKARFFRILVVARVPPSSPRYARKKGWMASWDVVADNPEEALHEVRRHEDVDVRGRLAIDQCEEVEARPDLPKGVYFRGPRHVWTEEED